MKDLHELPRFQDGLSFVYLERGHVDRHLNAVAHHTAQGLTPLPVASLALLMLGPGTTITHAAVKTLADNDCLVVWCGEQGVRFYACGLGRTRSARNLLRQAALCADPGLHAAVVRRMYEMRFDEPLPHELDLQQVRGREGVRVREAYAEASRRFGITWQGRSYKQEDWTAADPVNRALSAANACLYGIVHAAILATGYSPALGFIHTGKQLSFVYDIADLYKTEITLPAAFAIAARGPTELEGAVRRSCRDAFRQFGLLQRIVPDIEEALDVGDDTGKGTSRPARRTQPMDDRAEKRRLYWERVRTGQTETLAESNEANEIFWWDPADMERQ